MPEALSTLGLDLSIWYINEDLQIISKNKKDHIRKTIRCSGKEITVQDIGKNNEIVWYTSRFMGNEYERVISISARIRTQNHTGWLD